MGGTVGVSYDSHRSVRILALAQGDGGFRGNRKGSHEFIPNVPGPFGFDLGMSYEPARQKVRGVLGFSPFALSWVPTSPGNPAYRVRLGGRIELGPGDVWGYGLLEFTPFYTATVTEVRSTESGSYEPGYDHHLIGVPVVFGVGSHDSSKGDHGPTGAFAQGMIGVSYRYLRLFPKVINGERAVAPGPPPPP